MAENEKEKEEGIDVETLAQLRKFWEEKNQILPITFNESIEVIKERTETYFTLVSKYKEILEKASQVFEREHPEIIKTKDYEKANINEIENLIVSTVLSEHEPLEFKDLPSWTITNKRLMFALSPREDIERPYILRGNIQELLKTLEDPTAESMGKWIKDRTTSAVGLYDQTFLRNLVSAFALQYMNNPNATYITFKVKDIGQWMHADTRGTIEDFTRTPEQEEERKKRFNLADRLKEVQNLVGYSPQSETVYAVLNIGMVSIREGTCTMSSPWIRTLIQNMDEFERTESGYMPVSELIRPEAVTAPQKVTMLIIERLLVGLTQRGNRTDKQLNRNKTFPSGQRTFKISLKTLFEDIPEFRREVDNVEPRYANRALNRCIYGRDYVERKKEGRKSILEEYIEKYTDMHKYYKDLSIILPEKLTLTNQRATIKIIHYGINGSYEFNQTLNDLKTGATSQNDLEEDG